MIIPKITRLSRPVLLSGSYLTRNSSSLAAAKSYTASVHLPNTDFPLKDDFAKRDPLYSERSGLDLYIWQAQNKERPTFILQDGPPYANGPLHMGHALNKILKDIICRYKLLEGNRVVFTPGWDCHGLPIEMKALQANKKKGPLQPVETRQLARQTAKDAINLQKSGFDELNIMADWKDPYCTYDTMYELRQLSVFRELLAKGTIFRARKPVSYSPSTRTALAEAELLYYDITSPSVYVQFPIFKAAGHLAKDLENASFLIWTTTPWTLPANMSIMVNPDMEYSTIKIRNKSSPPLVVATALIENLGQMLGTNDIQIIKSFSGKDILDCTYTTPFSAGKDLPVLPSQHVTSTSGTGIVHSAPAHGIEDFDVFTKAFPQNTKDILVVVDGKGCYTSNIPAYKEKLSGLSVLSDGSEAVIEILQENNNLLLKQDYLHSYPHDWRTRKPVITLATSQWFADLSIIKNGAIDAIQETKFYPDTGKNRLQTRVKDRTEWCISRQRAWGVPIPALHVITENDIDNVILTTESLDHIINILVQKGVDYWFDGPVEEFIPPSLKGKLDPAKVYKSTDTMDVWFDSGVAWADLESRLEGDVQADVYLEGLDQHRGWFQSSLLTYVATADSRRTSAKAPFKNVITHGFVLDNRGEKMSKSLKNVLDPIKLIKDSGYGRDNLRHWAASVDYTRDVMISKEIMDRIKGGTKKFRATARFLLGNLSTCSESAIASFDVKDLSFVDKFVLHELYTLSKNATEAYNSFQFSKVISALQSFSTTTLSSFYMDVSKDTLYCDDLNSTRRLGILYTFRKILDVHTSLLAPILPHLAEEIYEYDTLRHKLEPKTPSIFYHKLPKLPESFENATVKNEMEQLLDFRKSIYSSLEKARNNKQINTSSEARIKIFTTKDCESFVNLLNREAENLSLMFSVSNVEILSQKETEVDAAWTYSGEHSIDSSATIEFELLPANLYKCPRCRLHSKQVDDEESLCTRCTKVTLV